MRFACADAVVIAAVAGAADTVPAAEAAGAVRRAGNDANAADSAVVAAGNLGAVSTRGAAVTVVERAGAAVSGRCTARTGGALFGLLIAPDTVMGSPSASLS